MDDANYKVIVVVFTILSADRAQDVFDGVLKHLALPSYAENGILFGPFFEAIGDGVALFGMNHRIGLARTRMAARAIKQTG